MVFAAPVADQLLALRVCGGIEELAAHERFAAATPDLVEAVAQGIGAFADGEFAPLNRIGDQQGATLADGVVTLPPGFREAYQAFVAQGWSGVAAPEAFGGQALPFTLAMCVLESLGAANLAFALLPMLSSGAIEALLHHGSTEQQARYLPKLVSGAWSGTMNLTEPQAGSDVGALRTMATRIDDGPDEGRYLIRGSKIFITWGEHECAENIVHLVLARTPEAPEGTRGISLFVVPKFLVGEDGAPGRRNDLRCISLEHKLGIHASPTCVMSYGDNDRCIGELVGREHEGMRAMFTMMNPARIHVGAQGVEIAERAWQQASAYARERVQSPRAGSPAKTPVAIVEHPDVRRMLLRMRALTEAARALLYYTTGQVDRGTLGDEAAGRRAELLVPLLKAWGSDIGVEVTSLGVQVHGGTGYIEETGAAQLYRDARIPPIYEGTNGIQAADYVARKLPMENGAVLGALMDDVAREAGDAMELAALARDCAEIGRWMLTEASLDDRLAGSVPFTTMSAVAVAGWQLQRQAAKAGPEHPAKATVAKFFLERIVPEARGLRAGATAGAAQLYALDAEVLAG